MVRGPEVEDLRRTEGQHSHPVCGQVPGEEGIFRIVQRDDEVRLLGARSRRSSLAYMAQHAFHRLEKDKQETSLQYTMWRFAENNDKESIEFNSVEIFVDEESVRSLKCCIDSVTGSVRLCTDPKRSRKTFVYEVKWYFEPNEANVWVEKDILIKMSYKRLDGREDDPQTVFPGIRIKPLIRPVVEIQLGDFGVDPESASYTQINQPSGGTKM